MSAYAGTQYCTRSDRNRPNQDSGQPGWAAGHHRHTCICDRPCTALGGYGTRAPQVTATGLILLWSECRMRL